MCQAKCVQAIINKGCLYFLVYRGFVMNVTSKLSACFFLIVLPPNCCFWQIHVVHKNLYIIYPYTVVEICAVSKQMEAKCLVYWLSKYAATGETTAS